MSVFWWKRTRTRINRQVLLVGGALDEADRTESIASSDWYSESSSIESLVVPELILAEQESLTVSGDYSDRVANLVEWNSVILLELLNRLVAQRQVVSTDPTTSTPKAAAKGILELTQTLNADTTPDSIMNEVVDIIEMPSFTTTSVPAIPASAHHKLSANVIQQLRQYVATMASLYNDNPCKCMCMSTPAHLTSVYLLIQSIALLCTQSAFASPHLVRTVHNFEHVRIYAPLCPVSTTNLNWKVNHMQLDAYMF